MTWDDLGWYIAFALSAALLILMTFWAGFWALLFLPIVAFLGWCCIPPRSEPQGGGEPKGFEDHGMDWDWPA